MIDLLQSKRLQRLSDINPLPLSDHLILLNCVDRLSAKDNLSISEYLRFSQVYRRIFNRLKKTQTGPLQLRQRAFNILYEIEWSAKVSYDKYCKSDYLAIYPVMKPDFEDLVDNVSTRYIDSVNTLIQRTHVSDPATVWAYAAPFFKLSTGAIIEDCAHVDDYSSYFVDSIACKTIYIYAKAIPSSEQRSLFKRCEKQLLRAHTEALAKRGDINDYISRFTRNFLELAGIETSYVNLGPFIDMSIELEEFLKDFETT